MILRGSAADRGCETDPVTAMRKLSLDALAREQLEVARRAAPSRSARTVVGGHEAALRQTVVALLANAELDEHENLGEATVQVLRGRVELTADVDRWEGRDGDLLVVPNARHAVRALEDSVILITAVPHAHHGQP
jgi:quercetin dioxygenase-like cupin family protein